MEWYNAAPGELLPGTDLEGAPLERVRLPDKKSKQRTAIYYNALLEVCSRQAPGAVVAQLLTNLRPEARPWIERLKQSGVPALYSVSQFPSWPSKPTKRWFRGAAYRKVYDAFDAIVTNSPALEEFLRSIGVTTRVEYIPNGVNLSRFYPAASAEAQGLRRELRARLNIPEQHQLIATVGALMPRKGQDLAIAAWSRVLTRHPDTHLLLIGPRSDQHDPKLAEFGAGIARLVAGSGAPEQVHFSGQVDDVENWLRAADVFLLPTKREGTPNSVLEAMATGLPSVITPYVGLSDAIGRSGEHYRLVERDADALSACLSDLLEHPAERQRLCDAGLAYIRDNMDQRHSLDRYAALYRELGDRAIRNGS
jgi:glycosyltransferase involved in cell wall biosynthesis